jgi:hypothetical protein
VNGRGYDQGEAKYGEIEDYLQPVEVDFFPKSRAEADIRVPAGSAVPNIVELKGPTTVQVKLGELRDTDGNGREQIPTEIVQMELTGTSPFGPVKVTIRDAGKDPFQRSSGEIEEGANDNPGILDLPPFIEEGPGGQRADSFFDVFFEVELPVLGLTLREAQGRQGRGQVDQGPGGPVRRERGPRLRRGRRATGQCVCEERRARAPLRPLRVEPRRRHLDRPRRRQLPGHDRQGVRGG